MKLTEAERNLTNTIFALVTCLGLVGSAAMRLDAAAVYWDPANGGNGHYYEVVPTAAATSWLDAKAEAAARGGYLASITSSNENEFVFGLIANDDRVWSAASGYETGPYIGGVQPPGSPEPGGGWQWVSGEAMVYTAWGTTEPNNIWGDNVVHYQSRGARLPTWNDIPDTVATIVQHSSSNSVPPGFVVEYESNPFPQASIRVSEVEISWPSAPNTRYQVQYRSETTNGEWIPLPTGSCVEGDGTVKLVLDKIAAGQAQRFYRVVVANCTP